MARISRVLIAVLVLVVLISSSCAKMGYDIVARVDSSSLEIHRSTQNLSLSLDSSINGIGNFSKYSHIRGSSGAESKETSSSPLEGTFSCDERIRLLTKEGPVAIQIGFNNGSLVDIGNADDGETIDDGEIMNSSLTESADIYINEKWPTAYSNRKKVSYQGNGLYSREFFKDNNGDIITSSGTFWRVSKDSLFTTRSNRTVIRARITPGSVDYFQATNTTTRYLLSSDSLGPDSHIGVFGRGESADDVIKISEDFVGEQKRTLKLNLTKTYWDKLDSYSWLSCCPSAEAEEGGIEKLYDYWNYWDFINQQ